MEAAAKRPAHIDFFLTDSRFLLLLFSLWPPSPLNLSRTLFFSLPLAFPSVPSGRPRRPSV